VVAQVQDIELLMLLIPVTSDPLEDACAVVQGVGHDADFGLFQGNNGASEIR